MIVVERQPGRALQTVCLTFGRGQRDEPLPGLAHLVEHVFHCRGTGGSAQFFAALRSAGAICNAYTGADYVQFWVSAPPAGLGHWARIARRQLADPVHEPETVRRELDVIAQEVASKVLRHPQRGFSTQYNRAALFDDEANAHSGFVDNPALRDLTPSDVADGFRFFLDPAVAQIASVGPLGSAELVELLSPVLEVLEGGAVPDAPRPHELSGPRVVRIDRADDSPHAHAVCFPVVRTGPWLTDLAVAQVVAALLGQGGGRSLAGRRAPAGSSVTARVGISGDPNEDRSPTCLTVEATGETEWLPDALTSALGTLADGLDPAVVADAARWVRIGAVKRFDRAVSRTRAATWLRMFARASVTDYLAALSDVDTERVAKLAVELAAHGGREIVL
ncbi:M16 family metallopeptidase [Amycolatopsis nalaikhensis]|uniref:Insulinase family protein n=1 Tax=Amycolatopsis nalaikhensis TaxID=715472 RepID=A0ABY8XR23_9PSEU|nr:insulinase family protein [Amycolatopsis sp. 2-2]WIV58053.1 insulinase family protein [Amycolatopsis sp. 2-2]